MMSTFISIIVLILWVIITVKINQLYHRIFTITYFGFKPLLMEWFVCILIGGMIASVPFSLLGLI